MQLKGTILKGAVLVGWAFGTAMVSSAVALQSAMWISDGFLVSSMSEALGLLCFGALVALPMGALGAIVACLLLWHTRLKHSIPLEPESRLPRRSFRGG